MIGQRFEIFDRDAYAHDKAVMLKKRRAALWSLIEENNPGKSGKVILFAPHEPAQGIFEQESSFYYFTLISESSSVFVFNKEKSDFYIPNFGDVREKWLDSVDMLTQKNIVSYGIDELKFLGERVQGYQMYPYFSGQDYASVILLLSDMVAKGETIFTLYPEHKNKYASVKMIVDYLEKFVPGLKAQIVDISPYVATLRRKKDAYEIDCMYRAIQITQVAFDAATHVLQPGSTEAQVQAAIEYVFTENGAKRAYPAIVGSGKKSTVLHYHTNNQDLKSGDVLLIDAGASFNHYCADITRVFPVSGKFSKRQKELYEIVLQTQLHVVDHIRPGVWLSNPKEQEASLYHIAIEFLKKHGYEKYFIHGIGHFLGLDVHDEGDALVPLQEGDVITIEPGIYIPEESIGIRIEDNYWVLQDLPPVCLSESIPKEIGEVEKMVEKSF